MYIADIGAENAYEKIYPKGSDGFDYIIHTASPVTFHVEDLQSGLIDPTIRPAQQRRGGLDFLRRHERCWKGLHRGELESCKLAHHQSSSIALAECFVSKLTFLGHR